MGQKNNRPLILVTNDDGYKSKGIEALTSIAAEIGNVVVVAASDSQSGKSHSITIKDPIRYKQLSTVNEIRRFVVRGTPADGVKLALNSILQRKPDLILSGINHGTNSSTSVVYSGTMAAAIEGAIHQIPSIGFSILDYGPDPDFEPSAGYLKQIIANVIEKGMDRGICLNVNIPAIPEDQLRGIRVCRQANGYWKEAFDVREDPRGAKYSWLTGSFINREPDAEDTDEWALRHGYLAVVPINSDFTDHASIAKMKSMEVNITVNENSREI